MVPLSINAHNSYCPFPVFVSCRFTMFAKGGVLSCQRLPLTLQNVTFNSTIGNLFEYVIYFSDSQVHTIKTTRRDTTRLHSLDSHQRQV